MNWGGFPVALRFPVQDYSLETKKRCWSYVLPALAYADLTDTTLLEAESAEVFDPDQLLYLAVVAPKTIPPSRKNSLLWRKDGRLMSALSSKKLQGNNNVRHRGDVFNGCPSKRLYPRRAACHWRNNQNRENKPPLNRFKSSNVRSWIK